MIHSSSTHALALSMSLATCSLRVVLEFENKPYARVTMEPMMNHVEHVKHACHSSEKVQTIFRVSNEGSRGCYGLRD